MKKLYISAVAILFAFSLSAQENMDWCEDFNNWETGEILREGWTGSVPANGSVLVNSFFTFIPWWDYFKETSILLLESNALTIFNQNFSENNEKTIEVITPGIRVSGKNPIISWLELYDWDFFRWYGFNRNLASRNLYISTDGHNWKLVDNYMTSDMPFDRTEWQRNKVYSLKEYIGQTIWWKFEVINRNSGTDFWIIDDVCVHQRPSMPILNHRPGEINSGGVKVNVGESKSQKICLTNEGASIARVKSIKLVSDNNNWSLTDTNNYPIEILGNEYAFADNGTNRLEVDVIFAPEDIGVSTARLNVTWGFNEDNVYEVPLTGKGISCFVPEEAYIGENWATSQDSWFTYTADKYQVVNINSCHPNQEITDRSDYAYDTYLNVFTNCTNVSWDIWDDTNPNIIAWNDDLDWGRKPWPYCPYNKFSSGVQFVMNEGETIYIFWPLVWRSPHDDEGFYFNIEPFYPVDGDVCEIAIPLTLPIVNHFGTTVGFEDDYRMSPCSPYANYMDGNDKVYTITLENEGYLTGSILGAYGSIHVLDTCPVEKLDKDHCIFFASGPNGGFNEKHFNPGTYYVIISSWAPPQTVDYLLNLSFSSLGVDQVQLNSAIMVFPNPTSDIINITGLTETAEVKLYSIQGRLLKTVNQVESSIDISDLPAGIYILKLSSGNTQKTERIIKR